MAQGFQHRTIVEFKLHVVRAIHPEHIHVILRRDRLVKSVQLNWTVRPELASIFTIQRIYSVPLAQEHFVVENGRAAHLNHFLIVHVEEILLRVLGIELLYRSAKTKWCSITIFYHHLIYCMSLKNKDGSDYRAYTIPNPLMSSQNLWGESNKYTLHNCKWEPEIVMADGRVIKKAKYGEPNPLPIKDEEPPKVEPKAENKGRPADLDAVTEELEQSVIDPESIVQIWCLPASITETVDPLYDEKYQRIKYGNKFLFEAVVLEQDDLYMVIWTNTKAVTLGSVIYPRTKDKRWWRVQSRADDNGGYVLSVTMSDFQPDFS